MANWFNTSIRFILLLSALLLGCSTLFAQDHKPVKRQRQILVTDSINNEQTETQQIEIQQPILVDSLFVAEEETKKTSKYDVWEPREMTFNPDPTRAVWMSALFPGLGQIYNRRYWKLPIVVGGFMGLAYATSWNNMMLTDYTRAYRDIMDSDPNTKSYMNFFPSTTKEESIDTTWLTNILQSRKNFYRRNRDLCIIAIVGVYFIAMVDAYVDAQLSHFDINPDLSIDWSPQVIPGSAGERPSLAMSWAITF